MLSPFNIAVSMSAVVIPRSFERVAAWTVKRYLPSFILDFIFSISKQLTALPSLLIIPNSSRFKKSRFIGMPVRLIIFALTSQAVVRYVVSWSHHLRNQGSGDGAENEADVQVQNEK
jgi:hypothetical protein